MMRAVSSPSRRLAIGDAYTFLMKELEKVDKKILEPLIGTSWPRDMPVVTGGGLLENIATIDVQYASSGVDEGNLIGDNTNDIPVIQADFSKSVARCFNFAEYISISVLEKEKMYGIGRDPETFLNKGIHLHFDKYCDQNVYQGFTGVASTGLVNNAGISRTSAANGTAGASRWSQKTADEILDDINTAISRLWKDNDCSPDALPNHILVPVAQFGALVTRKVSADATMSILEYVLKNNLSAQQGVDLTISPCKWCSRAGSSHTDRMVVYINREDRICFNLTQPLRRMDTERADMKIKIPYIGQFSEVRFLYPSTVHYMDGI